MPRLGPRHEPAVVRLAGPHEPGLAPVAGAAHQGVFEGMAPVLQGEAGSVGRGPPRRVDPGAGRPPAAGSHQRHEQRAVRLDHGAGRTTVEYAHRVVLQQLPVRHGVQARRLVHLDAGVGQVRYQLGDGPRGGLRVPSGHDEHRQRARGEHIRTGQPGLCPAARGRNPHPGRTGVAQLFLQARPVPGVGVIQHPRGELVLIRSADTDPHVGQVRVHGQRSVAGAVGSRGRGRDPLPGQRGHQVADRTALLAGAGPRGDHLRDANSAPAARHTPVVQRHPHHGREPHPGVRGTVQHERMFPHIHPAVAERAPDHRVAHFVHRPRPGDREREAHPYQAVLSNGPVEAGAELQPVEAVPRGHLGGEPQLADLAGGDEALPGRAHLGAYRTWQIGQRRPGPGGDDVPGTLAERGVVAILVVEHDGRAHLPFAQQVPSRPLVQDPAQRATAGRVGLDQECRALRAVARHRAPTGGCRVVGVPDSVHAVSGRRYVGRDERQRGRRERATGVPADAGDHHRNGCAAVVVDLHPRRPGIGELDRRDDQVGTGPGLCVDHDEGLAVAAGVHMRRHMRHRRPPHSGGQLVRLPPAADQVQVDLVRGDAGDAVVVRAEQQLPPGLVDRLGRESRAQQRGQGGEPLRVQQRGLARPVRLFHVDVRDFLARIHRVHVARLRAEPDAALRRLGAYPREELRR